MILVLRALGIGDLATAVPALRGLRAAFPDRSLVLAAPAWLAPLVELTGCVDRLLPMDGLGPVDGLGAYRWPVPAPFLAVNLHGRGPRSHRLLRAAAPGRLYAFRCAGAGHLDGPRWTADEHEVRRWCRLLRWYGVATDPADLGLRRPTRAGVPAGLTIVHPGGKEPRRRWAPERFAEVARELDRAGHRVVVTGSTAERDLAGWVAGRAGLPAGAVLAGRAGLAELAGLVAGARLVVSADTGVAHLATAYGTPSVVLFGPVRPEHWGPPPDRPWHRVLGGPPPVTPDVAVPSDAIAPSDAPAPRAPEAPSAPPSDPWSPPDPPREPGEPPGPGSALAEVGVADVLVAAEEAERRGRDRAALSR